ncbi:MAG TPA: Zn-dependent hydrolase, partial [Candidatus Acidoferrum sp.]|nr:Zn-dependent hydrolase [Candidatus Acidoferrum sp.]
FADEEGVRYQTAYLGSKALAGGFDAKDLQRRDGNGLTMADAIRRFGGNPGALRQARLSPRNLLGYFEAHIEQGPVLEKRGVPVGVVSAIAGQSRVSLEFRGTAGHAGTVPMGSRQDALAGAAEFVLAAERCGVIATVGVLEIKGAASNVIPGCVHLTLDARDANDSRRRLAVSRLRREAQAIAKRRGLRVQWTAVQATPAVACDNALSRRLSECVARQGIKVVNLPSGAGHDAAVMASITPVAMLFLRCAGGISHHPAESVQTRDVKLALDVMVDFLHAVGRALDEPQPGADAPHPFPLPIGWGEGGRRPGEGLSHAANAGPERARALPGQRHSAPARRHS